MKLFRSIPVSLLVILGTIFSIPAIAYKSLQYIDPADPDAFYAQYGKLNQVQLYL